jgi:hypothetical protein
LHSSVYARIAEQSYGVQYQHRQLNRNACARPALTDYRSRRGSFGDAGLQYVQRTALPFDWTSTLPFPVEIMAMPTFQSWRNVPDLTGLLMGSLTTMPLAVVLRELGTTSTVRRSRTISTSGPSRKSESGGWVAGVVKVNRCPRQSGHRARCPWIFCVTRHSNRQMAWNLFLQAACLARCSLSANAVRQIEQVSVKSSRPTWK